MLPERANDLVFVYTNSKIIANAKLTRNGRFYGEMEDPKDVETDDVDNSSETDVDSPLECGVELALYSS